MKVYEFNSDTNEITNDDRPEHLLDHHYEKSIISMYTSMQTEKILTNILVEVHKLNEDYPLEFITKLITIFFR